MSVDAHTCSCCAASSATAGTPATAASRRTVLRASAGALAGVAGMSALAACGSDDEGDGATATQDAGGAATTPAAGGALAAVADVPVGGALAVNGGDVIVAQPAEGTFVAYDSTCPHQGCKVAPTDAGLVCPCHASAFDLATGDRTAGPAETGLTTIAVTVDGENVVQA